MTGVTVERVDKYRQTRDFSSTAEPAGDAAATRPASRFVVQEHHARRLHWDFRLEHEGVLVSWALPRGVPATPEEQLPAARTEDHPLEYLGFEGTIPAGSYGAGEVTIWDSGAYECERFEEGKVVVRLHGERVRGRYALYQMDGDDWRIHRMDPPEDPAREPLPELIVPMFARLGALPHEQERYGFEVKWDGIRAIGYWEPGRWRLESRNLHDITAAWPELRAIGRQLGSRSVVLDGEIVAFDEHGRPSFERLQPRMHLRGDAAVRRRADEIPAVYIVFDLLWLDGQSLMAAAYEERRRHLEALKLEGPAWRTPGYHRGEGSALLAASREQGLEGIVAKRLDSHYEPGRRTPAWVKVKHTNRQELVVGGWLRADMGRSHALGALLVGHWEGEPPRLRYVGKVGIGYSEADRAMLREKLLPLERDESPFTGRQPVKNAIFVDPVLVAEIDFHERTASGMLRHPSYKGLRDDVDARDVVLEDGSRSDREQRTRPERIARGATTVEVDGRPLRLTNLGKVLYPRAGFTKAAVLDYYARIAPTLLPHIRGRPMTLKRYPDGVEGPHFYDKHCAGRPDWLPTAPMWSDRKRDEIHFCRIDDTAALIWSVNHGNLEMHPLLSVVPDLGTPTTLAFDLDPGEPAGPLDAAEIALVLRDMLAGVGLQTWAKSSGSRGVQVYAPLNCDTSFDAAKQFARSVAEVMANRMGDRVVARMDKRLRAGKVLVDWSQNDRHKSTVAAYSLRAKLERPTVSIPLSWAELQAAVDRGAARELLVGPDDALDRVRDHGDLFAPVLSTVQRLPGPAL
jgi:bifunctional non-homologous end joining protein LigD